MSNYTDKDRLLALAGVFQAADITRQLARTGEVRQEEYRASIDSLFEMSPDSVEQVFGGLDSISPGLACLYRQLDRPAERDVEITRYAASLLQLARKLFADSPKQAHLAEALDNLKSRKEAFDFDQSTVVAQIAKIYQETISNMSPRIMVKGDPEYLQDESTAARIRAALLAGIRAGHLWLQCGGKRWQLLLQRKQMASLAKRLM